MENNLKFSGVNIDAKALEEQYKNLKKSNTVAHQKKANFDPKNYLDLKLKPNESTKTLKIRLLPFSPKGGTSFFDIMTHSLKVNKEIAQSGFKSYVCLNDKKTESTEECPICKKSNELFNKAEEALKEGNKALYKSLYREACSLKKKRTFITRVIDREHEDEGVKFWRFNENSLGKGVYDMLMELYEVRKQEAIEDGEEGYNIFDLYNGKDIIVSVSKKLIPDGFGGMKDQISYSVTDSGNRKPLSKDADKASSWQNDEKTWKDVYSLKSADYLELVVNGKIPVYDKELGHFVEKKEFDAEAKRIEDEAASEILKNNYNTGDEVVNLDVEEVEEDLPF